MEVGLDLPIVIKKGLQIDDEVSNHREEGEGLDQSRLFRQIFDMSSAGQHIFAIDPHRAGAANGTPTGIAERKRLILFILNAQQSLQEIHSFPNFHPKGFDPSGRILLFMKTFDSEG